jgi:hypothetical protein
VFGDNQSVVSNSTSPLPLNKRHNAVYSHRVRENIAAKILGIDGKKNPADVVSKH